MLTFVEFQQYLLDWCLDRIDTTDIDEISKYCENYDPSLTALYAKEEQVRHKLLRAVEVRTVDVGLNSFDVEQLTAYLHDHLDSDASTSRTVFVVLVSTCAIVHEDTIPSEFLVSILDCCVLSSGVIGDPMLLWILGGYFLSTASACGLYEGGLFNVAATSMCLSAIELRWSEVPSDSKSTSVRAVETDPRFAGWRKELHARLQRVEQLLTAVSWSY